jgi:hypothetical protein
MARKPSRLELETELEQKSRALHLAENVLHAIANGEKPDAIERAAEPDSPESRYLFKLYRGARSHGGIVVTEYHYRDQSPLVSLHYLDGIDYGPSPSVLPLACAIERLKLARNRLLASEQA